MPALLGLGPSNPITWSNFYRKGGFRSMIGSAGAYFGILAALIFLSGRLEPRAAARIYGAWTNWLMGLQFLFVVVIGAGRVTNTIRGDQASGMAESLRMMPLPAGHAIVGYLSSAAASLGGFFVANFALGLMVNAMSEMPVHRWLAANAVFLAFALLVWTVAAFLAFLVKGAGAVLVVVSLVGVFGNVGLLYVAPALVVLAGPLVGSSVFETRTAQTELAMPMVLSLATQFLVGAIFFTGAARKYRRPEALALGAWLAMALLLTVVLTSLLGMVQMEWFRPGFLAREFNRTEPAVPFCGSTMLAMFVALIPLANFARLHVGWVRGRVDDPDRRRPVPPPYLAALIVVADLALLAFAFPGNPDWRRLACYGSALFGFSLSAIYIAAWFYRATDNAKVILSTWLVAYCLVPLAVDFARNRLSDERYDAPALGTIASLSPIGMVIEAASEERPHLRTGAIFHMLIPLLPFTLYVRRGQAKASSRPMSTTPA